MEFGSFLAAGKKLTNFFLCLFVKQDSVLGQTLHGPSVSETKTPTNVFWFRQFTFQTKESNQI